MSAGGSGRGPDTPAQSFAHASPPGSMGAFALLDSSAEASEESEGGVAVAAEPEASASPRVRESAEYRSTPIAPFGVHPLAGLSHAELIEVIAPQLPETLQFLGRYLGSAAAMRATESALWIQWPKDDRVASRMIAKLENKKALEGALARMCGRPMAIQWDFAEFTPAPAAVKSKGAAPPARRFSDSEPTLDYPDGELGGNGNGAEMDHSGYGSFERYPAEVGAMALPVAEEPKATAPRAPDITAESTRKILADGGELARRAKMVRDFFSGGFVDSNGHPVNV